MNKVIPIAVGVIIVLTAMVLLFSFDYRSGTATEEMEKFSGTPTPTITQAPQETPNGPSEIVQVDTSQDSGALTVTDQTKKPTLTCSKYDRVDVNGSGTTLTINGACRQIQLNGDNNHITADAATVFIFNGTGNQVTYSRFVNGKTPSVVNNQSGNDVQKVPYTSPAKDTGKNKTK